MAMTSGWIKMHRKITEWEWYRDGPTMRLFLHLLLVANRDPQKWRGTVIGRGQVLTSRAKLAAETGLSEQQIRTAFRNIKSTNEITKTSTKKQTVVTICNYERYQSMGDKSNQDPNQQLNQQSTNNQPSNEQEGKEVKKRESRRFTPPTPAEWLEYASEIGFPKPDAEAAFDHYTANGWKVGGKATMKDWKAAARNCKRRGNFNNPTQTAYGKTVSSSQRDRGTLNAGAADRYADGEVESLFG